MTMNPANNGVGTDPPPPPPLLRSSPHESPNPAESSLRESFLLLSHRLQPPFSLSIPSPSEYAHLNRAIAFAILTQPHLSKTHLTHLHSIVTDGYALFTSALIDLTTHSFPNLLDPPRSQLLWASAQMVDVAAARADALIVSLLRQIDGGDFSDPNLYLCSELVKLFLNKWDWMLDEPLVLTSALFVFLRLLADHYRLGGGPKMDSLKRMEIDFCVKVLRECFSLCLRIGRDLVRILQDVVYIPEIRDVWKDMLFDPGKLGAPGFTDIYQLYRTRTPVQYFLLRVSPEVETKLRFLMSQVKWGSQKRYQNWFVKKHLCSQGSETVIADIVRFICCAHHPPNEIIQSNVISRWAVIGWLLKCCRRNYFEANVKLALFYDWLFFDERVDNVMNIEPAILLMVHSVPEYIDITHTLLEFLFLLVDNYDVNQKEVIFRGVSMAFSVLIRKGVIHSLDPLISCDRLSPLLKERLATFVPSSSSGDVKSTSGTCSQKMLTNVEVGHACKI